MPVCIQPTDNIVIERHSVPIIRFSRNLLGNESVGAFCVGTSETQVTNIRICPRRINNTASDTSQSRESPSTGLYPGRRFAQIIKLKPEFIEKYKEVHAVVWPGVLEQIKDCNINDCM